MNCLPIVGRELRVAARKRSTFWLRVAAAVTGLVVGTGCLVLSRGQGARATEMGTILFYTLTWICFGAAFSAGLFFTSDCLSEEKREGTLGLLFLTELRGYDVVFGKLLSTSLRGFYGLLALFPIIAITQLMGGITAAQYWKDSLALVNGLFVSLAAGMLISALSRDSQKALGGTLLVLLLLAFGGPVADAVIAGVTKRAFHPSWSRLSPGYVLVTASAWGRSSYWEALPVTHLLGWAMFGLACVAAPHSWQDKRSVGAKSNTSWTYAWKYGGRRRRMRLSRRLLERQPMTWLVCRERWQSLGLWLMAVLAAGGFAGLLFGGTPQEAWIIWSYAGGLVILLLYLWAASQACRFLVEARPSGLLELILVSPLAEREIITGQWRAWLRMYGLPVLLLLGLHVAGATLSQRSFQRIAAKAGTVAVAGATNSSRTASPGTITVSTKSVTVSASVGTNAASAAGPFRAPSTGAQATMAVAAAGAAALSMLGNLAALGWFGMWMGLTSKSANLATLKTVLFVQIIPWFVSAFGTSIVVGLLMARFLFRGGAGQPGAFFVWWPLLSAGLSTAVALAKDAGFILWARRKLRSSLRQQAARSLGQPRLGAPPPLPRMGELMPAVTVPRG